MPYDSQYRTRKLPKHSRTIPLEGSKDRGNGLDYRRYFRCWHCGFICDIDRDSLGDSRSLSGVGYEEGSVTPDFGINNQSVMGILGHVFVSLELAADGTPKNADVVLAVISEGGCPLCGTKNWLGKY